jgi:hypothetical protein
MLLPANLPQCPVSQLVISHNKGSSGGDGANHLGARGGGGVGIGFRKPGFGSVPATDLM